MKRSRLLAVVLFVGDFLILYLSLYVALSLRNLSLPSEKLYQSLQLPFLYLFILWILVLFIFDLYQLPFFKQKLLFLKKVILFVIFSLLIGTAYFYLQPQLQLTPRAVLILTSFTAGVFLSLWRVLFSLFFRGKKFCQKVIIVGSCKEVEEIMDKDLRHIGYQIIAVFSKKDIIPGNIKVIRSFAELEEESKKADVAVLTPEVKEDKGFVKNIFESLPLMINYMDFSSFYEQITRKVPLYSVDELWFLENISRKRKKVNEVMKRVIEMLFAIVGLVLTVALFPFIAVVIKLNSSGPVIYSQERVGLGGKTFTLYKFRTMKDKEIDIPWREKEEGQITSIGKVLRNTHIDELPQFFNLFKGDVSVVGPRPEWIKTAKVFEKEIPFYHLRYLVRPGITGWAQLHYQASTSVEEAKEKFRYDLYYIKNRTALLDTIIFLKTLRTVF